MAGARRLKISEGSGGGRHRVGGATRQGLIPLSDRSGTKAW